jgi:ferredoxin
MEQTTTAVNPFDPPPRVYWNVTILDTGESFRSNTTDSVLENLRRTGRRGIPVGCRAGGCSVCKVEIVSGEFEIYRPMSREYVSDEDLAENKLLSCCVRAKSDLTVRVIGKLQKAITKFAQPCESSGA